MTLRDLIPVGATRKKTRARKPGRARVGPSARTEVRLSAPEAPEEGPRQG